MLGAVQSDLYILDDHAHILGAYKDLPSVRLYSSSAEDLRGDDGRYGGGSRGTVCIRYGGG